MSSFDERAREWDTPERRERAEDVAAAIRSAVHLDRDWRIIDIGAGTGLLGFSLVDEVGELVLADPSAGMLEVVAEKIRDLGRPTISAVRLDLAVDPPPRGGGFDLAVSLLVLHHVEDTRAALAAIFALLRPGGGSPLPTWTPRTARSTIRVPKGSITTVSSGRPWPAWRARPGSRVSRR